jgi:hypothetical protein
VTGSSIHRDDELRVRGKRAFEKTIIWFVADDTELGQRIAHREALDNFSDELWMIAEDVRVLFQDGWADPSLDKTGAREFVDQCRGVVLGREGRELQNAGVKDDSQGRAWRVAAPVRVASFRRTQPPRPRSSPCRGSGGAHGPVPGTA